MIERSTSAVTSAFRRRQKQAEEIGLHLYELTIENFEKYFSFSKYRPVFDCGGRYEPKYFLIGKLKGLPSNHGEVQRVQVDGVLTIPNYALLWVKVNGHWRRERVKLPRGYNVFKVCCRASDVDRFLQLLKRASELARKHEVTKSEIAKPTPRKKVTLVKLKKKVVKPRTSSTPSRKKVIKPKKVKRATPKKKVEVRVKSRKSLKRRAKNIQKKRSKRARTMDAKRTCKRTLPVTIKNIRLWKKKPGRIDLYGIDTKGRGKY